MLTRNAALAGSGAAIGLALTPFMAAVWAYGPGVDWSEFTLVERIFGPLLERNGLLTFGRDGLDGGDGLPYEVYGKGFFLVYLLMLPAVRAVRPGARGAGIISQMALWGWSGLYGAMLIAMGADFVSYCGKSVPGRAGNALWSIGGAIEIITIMAFLACTLAFAVTAWTARLLPGWAAVALAAGVASVFPVTLFVTTYWPNAFIVPLSIAWAAVAAGAGRSAIDAVAAGTFHIYPISTVDEGLALFSGQDPEIGTPDGQSSFHQRVRERLEYWVRCARAARSDETLAVAQK